jgi:hypothetical protein
MKQSIVLLLFLGYMISGCKTQGALEGYQNTLIEFGKGGGFTGQEKTYSIDSKGNMQLVDGLLQNNQTLPKPKKSEVKKIFQALSDVDLSKIEFDHPGNMYYFIREISPSDTNEVIWGNPEQQVPQNIQDFYNLLNATINE